MTPSRRTLLSSGLAFTAGLASRAEGTLNPEPARSCPGPTAGGKLNCDPNVRDAAARDFGHILHKQPRAVLKPASAADIADLIRWAAERGLKVAARGRGHSTYGRSMAEDGVVIDMSAISAVHSVGPDRVAVDAGATWKSVLLEAALARGLTPLVLTNYLGLSIGGTLAVGGIGGTSSRHGMQTDQVLSLDVVTGSGQELTCSAAMNADLFDAVRAGLGQCGIVTRATLRLVRAPQRVRRYQLFYPNLAPLSADQRRVLADGRFDSLQGAILPDGAGGWRYQLDGAIFYWGDAIPDDAKALAGLSDERGARTIRDATYGDDMLAFAKFAQLLKSSGHWFNPQPWLLTFLRGSDADKIAGEILAELTDADLGPFGRITYYPMFRSAIRTPLVRMPDEEVVFPFNLIRIPASNDSAQTERMIVQNRALYERIRDAGGVLYPVSAIPTSPDDWKGHFGSKWQRFEEAARRYDPRNILTPGYDIFGQA